MTARRSGPTGESGPAGGEPGGDLPAGPFGPWLEDLEAALDGGRDSDVPCGTCTACCTASQFVHIGPDETATLARIAPELLFPAPGWPPGHRLLGYDEQGHCPMLVDGACSIYADRPATCRVYDCRVLAAAGLSPEEPTKVEIGRRVARWRFDVTDPDDSTREQAVQAAARFLAGHPDLVAGEELPRAATPLAVLAVEVHRAFLGADPVTGALTVVEPDPATVVAALPRRR